MGYQCPSDSGAVPTSVPYSSRGRSPMQRATLMGTWPPAERHKQPDIYPLPASTPQSLLLRNLPEGREQDPLTQRCSSHTQRVRTLLGSQCKVVAEWALSYSKSYHYNSIHQKGLHTHSHVGSKETTTTKNKFLYVVGSPLNVYTSMTSRYFPINSTLKNISKQCKMLLVVWVWWSIFHEYVDGF